MAPPVSAWPPSLLNAYARRFREAAPRQLEALALQFGDPSVRPLLSHLATGGSVTFETLADAFLASGSPPSSMSAGHVQWEWVAALARVVALQDLHADDLPLGLGIYRHLHARDHISTYGAIHAKLFGDLLLTVGADRELQALLRTNAIAPTDRRLLLADLHNPWRGGPLAVAPADWARDFETASELCTDPPLELATGGDVAFDRLSSSSAGRTLVDGLISVIFPVYQPGASLFPAVSSICAQTWDDLEIIIVDDGSGPAYRDTLEQVASSDPRIRLIRRAGNGGAYAARNVGLSLARGQFVAFQDHDDWSHPRRLELQARPLQADRALVATHSRCVRVNESLQLAHPGYSPLRHNASSILFRRHEVTLGVGYFDEVRKSGDSEYHGRIVAHFGRSAVNNLRREPVLAVVRRLDRSLSRSDFRAGWHHPDRVWYRDSYRRWHSRSKRSELFVNFEAERRPFVAPQAFDPAGPSAPDLDLVVLSDWRANVDANRELLAWCRHQAVEGARVGVGHLNSLAHTTELRPPLIPAVVDLVHGEDVMYLGSQEPCQIRRLIIVLPSVLHFATAASAWEVGGEVLILADTEASISENHDGVYDVAHSSDRVRSLFGCDPVWLPLSALPDCVDHQG